MARKPAGMEVVPATLLHQVAPNTSTIGLSARTRPAGTSSNSVALRVVRLDAIDQMESGFKSCDAGRKAVPEH